MVALALDLHCVSEATEPAEATRAHLVASRRSKTGHLKLWERIIEVASWQQCSAYFRFFNTFIWGLKSDYSHHSLQIFAVFIVFIWPFHRFPAVFMSFCCRGAGIWAWAMPCWAPTDWFIWPRSLPPMRPWYQLNMRTMIMVCLRSIVVLKMMILSLT